MVQQVAVRPTDEQRPPRKPSGRANAAIPDLIAAARRRLLAGAGARLRAPVVVATWIAKCDMWKRRIKFVVTIVRCNTSEF